MMCRTESRHQESHCSSFRTVVLHLVVIAQVDGLQRPLRRVAGDRLMRPAAGILLEPEVLFEDEEQRVVFPAGVGHEVHGHVLIVCVLGHFRGFSKSFKRPLIYI